jgi:hypothetical protein
MNQSFTARSGKEIRVVLSALVSFAPVWATATQPIAELGSPRFWSAADAHEAGGYRLLITESETFLRDLIAGDPMVSMSPRDFVRERVVYADAFEL